MYNTQISMFEIRCKTFPTSTYQKMFTQTSYMTNCGKFKCSNNNKAIVSTISLKINLLFFWNIHVLSEACCMHLECECRLLGLPTKIAFKLFSELYLPEKWWKKLSHWYLQIKCKLILSQKRKNTTQSSFNWWCQMFCATATFNYILFSH